MSIQTFAAAQVNSRSRAPFVGTMAQLSLATAHGTFTCLLAGAEADAALALIAEGRPLPVTLVEEQIVGAGEVLTFTKAVPDLASSQPVAQTAQA